MSRARTHRVYRWQMCVGWCACWEPTNSRNCHPRHGGRVACLWVMEKNSNGWNFLRLSCATFSWKDRHSKARQGVCWKSGLVARGPWLVCPEWVEAWKVSTTPGMDWKVFPQTENTTTTPMEEGGGIKPTAALLFLFQLHSNNADAITPNWYIFDTTVLSGKLTEHAQSCHIQQYTIDSNFSVAAEEWGNHQWFHHCFTTYSSDNWFHRLGAWWRWFTAP